MDRTRALSALDAALLRIIVAGDTPEAKPAEAPTPRKATTPRKAEATKSPPKTPASPAAAGK